MLTVNKLIAQGQGLAAVLLKRATEVELDWDVRQKSRFDVTDGTGRHLGVFLPRGTVVRGGDVLVAEDGSLVRVRAAAQPVLQVRACAEHGSPFDLLRAAYHLGNRHVPLALAPEVLTLEPDHVLAEMLRHMHLIVTETQAAFEPEGGAYGAGAGGPTSNHGHGHGHGHGHDHGHDHGHHHDHRAAGRDVGHEAGHEAGDNADHVHGPGCTHDHGHAHGHTAPAAAPVRGKPIGIAVRSEAKPHVHGPGCGHDHGPTDPHDHGHGD